MSRERPFRAPSWKMAPKRDGNICAVPAKRPALGHGKNYGGDVEKYGSLDKINFI